jgi:BASS family bile acid:Na+ symporter
VIVLVDVWLPAWRAGLRVALASAALAVCGLTLGHLLGGPDRATRTALAIASGARNGGLALLVASANHAPDEVEGAVVAYLLVSALLVTPYLAWRRRAPPTPQNTNLA